MKGFRYNAKERTDRKFNTCGREKNPMKIRFFATSLENAEPYRYVYWQDGDIAYECELQTEEINAKLFDMEANFRSLDTYKSYVAEKLSEMRKDYVANLEAASSKKSKKMWSEAIALIDNGKEEENFAEYLKRESFQMLSDFERQVSLVAELKSLGFEGYKTKKEIALF